MQSLGSTLNVNDIKRGPIIWKSVLNSLAKEGRKTVKFQFNQNARKSSGLKVVQVLN